MTPATVRVGLLNVSYRQYYYTTGNTLYSFIESLVHTIPDYCGVRLTSVRIYTGKTLSRENLLGTFKGKCSSTLLSRVAESDSLTVILNCDGLVKFSALLRPGGSLRFSVGGTRFQKPHYAGHVRQLISTELSFILKVFETMFPLHVPDHFDYYILLFNGIYSKAHGWKNTEQSARCIRDTGLFAHVQNPDYSGTVRRKGAILCYMHTDRKQGVVKVNKANYHLMGFTKIASIDEALRKLESLPAPP